MERNWIILATWAHLPGLTEEEVTEIVDRFLRGELR